MWCGSMVDGRRDPEQVGYEWAAWWALQGDEPLERVHECAVDLQRKLGDISARLNRQGEHEAEEIVAAANLFLIAIAEILDPNGTSEFKAEIKRRKSGKPINKHERALRGRSAASAVQRLVDGGWKQEAAIHQVVGDTGLSRAEIMTWLASRRRWLKPEA